MIRQAELYTAPSRISIAAHCVYFRASALHAGGRQFHPYPAYWSDDLRECEIFVALASVEPLLTELDTLYKQGHFGQLDSHFQELENASKKARSEEESATAGTSTTSELDGEKQYLSDNYRDRSV